jgi:putative proteasome-type protease
MLIYPQGNYITSSPETPYLQIGESKYGKPALDRIVHPGLSLNQGARLALVSLDATTRSNITVGPPFELATYEKDSLTIGVRCRFDADDKYLITVREAWNNGIQEAFLNLPKFSWETSASSQVATPQPTAVQSTRA